jgi:hypothetical protein
MFASSRVVGRVYRLENRAEGVAVTLAPAGFTEVVRDANIHMDFDVDMGDMVMRQYPDLIETGGIRPLADNTSATRRELLKVSSAARGDWMGDELHVVADTIPIALQPHAPPPPEESLVTKNKISVSAGNLEVEVALKQERTHASGDEDKKAVSLSGAYRAAGEKAKKDVGPGKASTGLKFGSELTLYGKKLHVRASLPVHSGSVDQAAVFIIEGFNEMSIGLFGGSENDLSDNTKMRVEVELTMPLRN